MIELQEIFSIQYGNKFDMNKMSISDKNIGINFVSRTSKNNGVVCTVDCYNNIDPYESDLITVSLGGTYVLSSFVQTQPFYTGQNVVILKPRVMMSLTEKLFYTHSITVNRYRFSAFGREANRSLKKLQIPSLDEIPDWVNDFNIFKYNNIHKSILKKHPVKLNMDDWKSFNIGDLFDIENCKCPNASELLEDGHDIFYIGAKKSNNGLMNKVKINKNLVTKGNCVVFICDGQGSVGYSNYMPDSFIGSTTLSVGYNKNLNKYIGLFLVTLLDLERPKYSFGRKYRNSLAMAKIKLPTTPQGNPDWKFMEDYIKSLPYSANL
ncbi:MAG: restriction endonuclease subunit S [Alphaproteobacteria bacterium]